MQITDIISLLGGLAFFLFGMSLLGSGLKRVAGGKLETVLGRLTSNPIKGVLLGALVTAAIQSSSATTVMVVGFVNSGIMQLNNAVGIIMGANVGTTATGWILTLAGVEGESGFSAATVFALIAFIGIILYFFCKKQSQKNLGLTLLAFSVLMSGMQTMSSAMDPLKESPAFLEFLSAVSNPVLAMIFGIAFTALIQSNSAAVGILQALSVTGVISYGTAIPMILGMGIGACVPVLLSAIGANNDGKRTALIYLYFNIFGSAIMLIPYCVALAMGNEFLALPATAFGIAIANTVYKIAATIFQLPFTKFMVQVAKLSVPDKQVDGEEDVYEENLLDERFLAYPPLALEQSGRTVEQMAKASVKNLNRSLDLFQEFNQEKFAKIQSRENVVDRFEDRIGKYLVQLNSKELNERETLLSSEYLHCLTNLERISDRAVNLSQLAQEIHNKGITFSEEGIQDVKVCTAAVREIVANTQEALLEESEEAAMKVQPLEDVIRTLLEAAKLRHIRRLQSGACTLEMGFVLNDYLGNLERVAAHCSNIALAVLEVKNRDAVQAHTYTRGMRRGDHPEFRRWLAYYQDKYLPGIKEETA